jgi:hypothetical protein
MFIVRDKKRIVRCVKQVRSIAPGSEKSGDTLFG